MISVRRVFGGWPHWAHEVSIIVEDSDIKYVGPEGDVKDLMPSPERLELLVEIFEDLNERSPENADDWSEIASYNLGSFSPSTPPVEQKYRTLKEATRGEQKLIDEDMERRDEELSKERIYSDSEMGMSENDSLEVGTDDNTDEVVSLVLSKSFNSDSSQAFWRVDGAWSDTNPLSLSEDEEEDITYHEVSPDYIEIYDEGSRDPEDFKNFLVDGPSITAAVSASCPPATQNVELNLANRQKAIDGAGYGPMNPKRPNEAFWQAKADRWSTTIEEARTSKCGNCAAFIITPTMRECIDQGLGGDQDSWSVVEAGELGYCEAFDFKCAAERTCDAWIVGGPVTEEKK